jgi:hypothetical protein
MPNQSIPAQFCDVHPGQLARWTLNSGQTKKMIQFACRGPDKNAADIRTNGLRVMRLDSSSSWQTPVNIPSATKCVHLEILILD